MSKKIESLSMFFYIVSVVFILDSIGYGQLGTYVLIPLGFLYFFTRNYILTKFVFKRKAVKWYIIFFTISSMSILYALDMDAAISTQRKMLIVFMFSLAVFSYSVTSLNNINIVYLANAFILLILILYISALGIDLSENNRAEEGVLNANTYGYYIFNGMFSLFALYSSLKLGFKLKKMFFIVIILGSLYSFWLILISASRGASILVTLLIIGNFLIIFYKTNRGILRRLFFLLIIFTSVFYLINYLNTNILQDSFLIKRFDQLEERGTPREFHLKKAIEVGIDNVFTGVGAGNYAIVPKEIEQGSFTHNTYAEAFANFGFFGLLIYILFYFSILLKVKSLLKVLLGKERIVLYQIFWFLLIFLVYSTLYVVYLSNVFMHFLFVIYAHLIVLERRKIILIK